MRFWITKNPRVALILVPWFIEHDQSREEIYLELRHRLTYNADETFVCLAIENDLIKGMTIAYCRSRDVFIWQAITEKGVPHGIVDIAFQGIGYWAKSKGYNRISGIPNRTRKIWERRWGFQKSKENKSEVFKEI